MALPPMWKVRREVRRAWIRTQISIWLRLGNKKHLQYHGLSVPVFRSGMTKGVLIQIARDDYETPEIRGLQIAVRLGDRVLELGSGLGIVTVLAARAIGPKGKLLSFEANPYMIPDTREFLSEHGVSNVELRHAVLVPWNSLDHSRRFHIGGSFPSSSLLSSNGHKTKQSIDVPTQTIDRVMNEFRPDVLICDIEGGEAELIPALDASGLRAVVIELHPDRLGQDELDAIHSALAAHGLHPTKEPLGGTVVLFHRLPHP